MTKILLTGACGRIGSALLDHLDSTYSFTLLDSDSAVEGIEADPPATIDDREIADVGNFDEMVAAIDDHDAIVHLAGDPRTEASWSSVLNSNIIGTYNCLEAAIEAQVDTFVFASSNHVVGMYERQHAPAIYDSDHDLVIDRFSPPRPDSLYGTSKGFGELLGRQYVETRNFPTRFYALRIGSLRSPPYDHPFGDAERGVSEGRRDRDSDEYDRAARRMHATWLSRRDMAQLVECCLEDETVEFDIFYGISDNECRWFDLDHARSVLDYRPEDSAEEYDSPPG
jgi:nucleoside-diphosphate-sugar epimerase